jgi:hypothetical protein
VSDKTGDSYASARGIVWPDDERAEYNKGEDSGKVKAGSILQAESLLLDHLQ